MKPRPPEGVQTKDWTTRAAGVIYCCLFVGLSELVCSEAQRFWTGDAGEKQLHSKGAKQRKKRGDLFEFIFWGIQEGIRLQKKTVDKEVKPGQTAQ